MSVNVGDTVRILPTDFVRRGESIDGLELVGRQGTVLALAGEHDPGMVAIFGMPEDAVLIQTEDTGDERWDVDGTFLRQEDVERVAA